ncbi:hypothetical protein HDU91_005307 [Kappamyces sp. JEL0680]|nr:hypothetical protein HDU91_005307 [Kappamyces sp. JEL0680]
MSLNRTRLTSDERAFELYPDEKLFYTNDSVELEYDNSGGYPGSGQQLLCQKGQIFISNIRVVYIAARPTVSLSSLAIPLQNLE